MIELFDCAPDTAVDEAEYVRLLGYPRGHQLTDRARELADEARRRYAHTGVPGCTRAKAVSSRWRVVSVTIDKRAFHSARLERTLREADADRVMLVAVSAGPEIEAAAQEAWRADRPDEYFFLEIYGSAVVEHLITMTGARLCAWADGERLAVLPHDSPGYPEWDIVEQARLLETIGQDELPSTVDVLDSGMLRPKKSLLAVFGVTPHVDRVADLRQLVPCEQCAYAGCQFRRVPYLRATEDVGSDRRGRNEGRPETAAFYATSVRALRRWADDRLTLSRRPDGSIEAIFRYDGSTCSNMGRALAFRYIVILDDRDGGYRIREQSCEPVPGEHGYEFMCEYIREGESLIDAIRTEAPLVGRLLDDVLSWSRPTLGPACYCEPESRLHKWGLVLETIHFALRQRREEGALSGRGQGPAPTRTV